MQPSSHHQCSFDRRRAPNSASPESVTLRAKGSKRLDSLICQASNGVVGEPFRSPESLEACSWSRGRTAHASKVTPWNGRINGLRLFLNENSPPSYTRSKQPKERATFKTRPMANSALRLAIISLIKPYRAANARPRYQDPLHMAVRTGL